MRSYKFIVSGSVQGVYYRKSVLDNAKDAGFSGYVKNLNDGTVEAAVTCEDNSLDEFLWILRSGSKSSEVEQIEKFDIKETFTRGFEVIY